MRGHIITVNRFCDALSRKLNCQAWTAATTWNASKAVVIQLAAWWILQQVRQVMPKRSAKKLRWVADKGKIRLTRANSPAQRPVSMNNFILKRTRKTLTATYIVWRRTLALDHRLQSQFLWTTNGRIRCWEARTENKLVQLVRMERVWIKKSPVKILPAAIA